MILYFADRRFNILDQASTSLPDGLVVDDDNKIEEVETGIATFECVLPFDSKTRERVKACAKVGNFILRSHNDENEYYTITQTEWNEKNREVYIYAEDAGLDLLNEIVGTYAATEAKPISHYIEQFAYDSGFVIGTNDIATLTRKFSWDGTDTVTSRLASVATQFDNAEISYSFEVKGLKVVKKLINIHKKRGQDAGVQLRFNKEIDNIVITESIDNVATALRVTGGIPEDKETPITLDGVLYDDGDIFLEGTYLKSRKAHAVWSRYLAENGTYTGHICKRFEYDTTSQTELLNRAIAELKKIREIEANYEIDITRLPENVKVGDRVSVVNDEDELYVSARILKLETSVANETQKATIGEYLIKSSGISKKVEELANQFASESVEIKKAHQEALEAQKKAEEAKQTADNAASDVGTLSGEVAASQEAINLANQAAQNAQVNASEAITQATLALSSASEAKSQVSTVSGKADQAISDASDASAMAQAAKLDLEQAKKDLDAFEKGLETLGSTMTADYARKTDLTSLESSMQSQITQSANEIKSTVSSTYATKSELNNKVSDYTIEIYNGTGGNPKPVRFASVDYSTCNSENGVAVKIGMVSGHGNGTSYSFLQDAIIRVNYLGEVEVDNTKQYGAETPNYDNEVRHYGDIFAVVDTTNKIVDFYCLMGQYSRVNMTPWKRLTYSSGGSVTQYTSCTVYSSGDKQWANNSDIALQTSVDDLATRVTKAETDITQSAEQIALRATKTEVTEALDGYYTKEESNAAINAKADSITSSVSKTYATQSALTETDKKATDAATAAGNAQTTANQAKSAASTNASNITSLSTRVSQTESSITSQAKSISEHGTKISTLEQTANGFSVSLQTLEGNVSTAQSTANTAKTNAATAQSTANEAKTAASNANTAASNAQSTANTAKTNAANAQSTADTAKTNAATAQSTANEAKTNAANAAKTATNFMSFDSSNGLLVGNKSSGSWSGYRTQIKSDSFNVLDASGNQLATYGANKIELGKNNENTVIDLCKGRGQIKMDSSKEFLQFTGEFVQMLSKGTVTDDEYGDFDTVAGVDASYINGGTRGWRGARLFAYDQNTSDENNAGGSWVNVDHEYLTMEQFAGNYENYAGATFMGGHADIEADQYVQVTAPFLTMNGDLVVTGDIEDNFGTRYRNGLASYTGSGTAAIDPNTTLEQLILTDKNTPVSSTFFYIETNFYSTKSATARRMQVAYPYNSDLSMYFRYYTTAWTSWKEIPMLVGSGTSGVWNYEKWSNGKARVWGSVHVDNVSIATAIGSFFRTGVIFNVASYLYPFTFKSAPIVSHSFYSTNGSSAFLWTSSESKTDRPPEFYFMRPNSATVSGDIQIIAEGKWK